MSDQAVPSLIAEFLERLAGRESLDYEVKAARGGLPQSMWSTISAFANTRGGWVVLGIAERDGEYVVDGVPNPEVLLQQFSDQVRNPQKISHAVCGPMDASIDSLGGRPLIVIRVPAAPRRTRPVYVDGNPYAGTFVRRHAGDYRCTRPEVERMMREAADLSADRVIPTGFGWDDLDRGTLARYRRRLQTNRPDSPFNALDDEAFLQAIGGWRLDRETGQQGITVAGLLMFGTDEAIREWRGRHLIDYRHVPGDALERIDVRWLDRLAWEGNLFGAFEAIYSRLAADLPVPFMVEHGYRIDQGPQHIALREALVNLLVHADYRERDASLILRSEQGYLFRNPGDSRAVSLELAEGDRSDPRNPELVRMFRFVGLADEAGTGIPKIMLAWRTLGYQPPGFEIGEERYEFVISLRFAHLLSDDDREWLAWLGVPFTEADRLALVIARHEGWIDNGTLRQVTGQHPADVTRVLGGLRDQGLLQMIGGGRGAKYQLDPSVPVRVPRIPGEARTAGAELNSTGTKLNSAGTKLSSTPEQQALIDTSVTPATGSALVSDPIWPDLEKIAEPVSSSEFIEAKQRDDIITRLCAMHPLSLVELMWLLRRDKGYLRRIIKDLLATGRIRYLYADRPRHPAQRYLAAPTNGWEPLESPTKPTNQE